MRPGYVIERRRTFAIPAPLFGIACLFLAACAHPQLPDSVSVGAAPSDSDSPFSVVMDLRALVVGRHPAAVAQASEDLRRLGFTVIQRDRVQRILDEQDPHLDHPLAAQAYFIRSGGLSGAEVVVLVDVDGPKDAPSVIVKGIDVETGAILWSGGILSTRDAKEAEYNRVVIDLTHRAVMDGFTKP